MFWSGWLSFRIKQAKLSLAPEGSSKVTVRAAFRCRVEVFPNNKKRLPVFVRICIASDMVDGESTFFASLQADIAIP
jgi:hypothetical protein